MGDIHKVMGIQSRHDPLNGCVMTGEPICRSLHVVFGPRYIQGSGSIAKVELGVDDE
jgi:hypothetical protein